MTKSCLEILMADQREPQIYEEKPPQKARMCSASISSCCSVCDMLIVSSTVHKGANCTKSECSEGHWIGGKTWNRLWRVTKPKSKKN